MSDQPKRHIITTESFGAPEKLISGVEPGQQLAPAPLAQPEQPPKLAKIDIDELTPLIISIVPMALGPMGVTTYLLTIQPTLEIQASNAADCFGKEYGMQKSQVFVLYDGPVPAEPEIELHEETAPE